MSIECKQLRAESLRIYNARLISKQQTKTQMSVVAHALIHPSAYTHRTYTSLSLYLARHPSIRFPLHSSKCVRWPVAIVDGMRRCVGQRDNANETGYGKRLLNIYPFTV